MENKRERERTRQTVGNGKSPRERAGCVAPHRDSLVRSLSASSSSRIFFLFRLRHRIRGIADAGGAELCSLPALNIYIYIHTQARYTRVFLDLHIPRIRITSTTSPAAHLAIFPIKSKEKYNELECMSVCV